MDLNEIRAKRMQEMKSASGGMSGLPQGLPENMPGMSNPQQDSEKQAQMESMRENMLQQVLDNTARERLNRISMVKPEKARAVEDLLLRMVQCSYKHLIRLNLVKLGKRWGKSN